MNDVIIVALISFSGTLIGTFAGILTSSRLTNYRIEQLEKKVERHNQVIDRVYELEKDYAVLDEDLKNMKKNVNGTIQELKEYHK
jgi:hypothetical protein|nr:MAG TPA: YtxH-like protein [Caudoviricetes sp.]